MSVPPDQMGNIQAVSMSPQQAALAASEGLPFAFNANSAASQLAFESALQNNGLAIEPAGNTPAASSAGDSLTPSQQYAQDFEQGFSLVSGAATDTLGNPLSSKSGGFSWFDPATWGNAGLVIVGIILALGALLISQKQTVVKVGDTVAKTAAVLS